MATFPFAVVSPERNAFEGEASSVSLRAAGGDIGFLAGHVPYIGVVEISVCEIVLEDGSELRLAVHGGFVEVDPEGSVTLLADVVERPEEIDVARARAARQRAVEAQAATPNDEENPEAEAAQARADTRLVAAGAAEAAS